MMSEQIHQRRRMLVTAAELIAPCLDPSDADKGFQWCMDDLNRANMPSVARDLMMAKAAYFLSKGLTDKAIDVFKQCEKHSGAARLNAATNLSFMYLLEGKASESLRYAQMAREQDGYHAQVRHFAVWTTPYTYMGTPVLKIDATIWKR
jgi:hypothetical protein